MRRPNLWCVALVGVTLLGAAACTDSDIDKGDSANVVMQILDIDNREVQGDTETGVCTVSGAICLDSSDCDPDDPLDVCFIDPAAAECIIQEWSASIANTTKSDLADTSPFNDIVLVDATIVYEWLNGFAMDPLTFPLTGTIAAGANQTVTFFPISAEDLTLLRLAFPSQSRTANVSLTFRGRVEDGESISRTTGSQLFVEACN